MGFLFSLFLTVFGAVLGGAGLLDQEAVVAVFGAVLLLFGISGFFIRG